MKTHQPLRPISFFLMTRAHIPIEWCRYVRNTVTVHDHTNHSRFMPISLGPATSVSPNWSLEFQDACQSPDWIALLLCVTMFRVHIMFDLDCRNFHDLQHAIRILLSSCFNCLECVGNVILTILFRILGLYLENTNKIPLWIKGDFSPKSLSISLTSTSFETKVLLCRFRMR